MSTNSPETPQQSQRFDNSHEDTDDFNRSSDIEQDKRNEPSTTPINEFTDDDETASSDSNNTSISDNNEYDICVKKLKKCNGLKLAHLNVCSMYRKLDELRFLLMKINLDILCISETWLSQTTSDNLISIHGYTLFRRDRVDGCRGGDVCIYAKKHIIMY